MTIQKTSPQFIDLSYLEKFVMNTLFVIVLGYIFLAGYYSRFLIMTDMRWFATVVPFFLIGLFFLSRTVSLNNKSALSCQTRSPDGLSSNSWSFYKGGKKTSFELGEISALQKSYRGLYSSFVITVGNTKISIPAELKILDEFLTDLSKSLQLSQEQTDELMKFHENAKCVFFEMERASKFLRYFCFLIPPIAFFTARNVWETGSEIIGVLWVFLSLIFLYFWTVFHWVLLQCGVKNFSIFSRISTLWAISGVLLYMSFGIAFRQFYQWLVFSLRGW